MRLPTDITPGLVRLWVIAPTFALLLVAGIEAMGRTGSSRGAMMALFTVGILGYGALVSRLLYIWTKHERNEGE